MPERSRSMMKNSPPPRTSQQTARKPRQPGNPYSPSLSLSPPRHAGIQDRDCSVSPPEAL